MPEQVTKEEQFQWGALIVGAIIALPVLIPLIWILS